MALIIVISTEDFQIRRNVLSLSFSERESGKWPLGLSNFYHNYLLSNDCIQHSGKISICNTQLKQFQVMGIPRKGGQRLSVIYLNIVLLIIKNFTKYLKTHPSEQIHTKNHLKSFPRTIKRQLTCPIEFISGSSLIGRNSILVIPRNQLDLTMKKFSKSTAKTGEMTLFLYSHFQLTMEVGLSIQLNRRSTLNNDLLFV